MKKGKKIVTGILGLALAFSAFGAGYAAFADYPELPRAVADAAAGNRARLVVRLERLVYARRI